MWVWNFAAFNAAWFINSLPGLELANPVVKLAAVSNLAFSSAFFIALFAMPDFVRPFFSKSFSTASFPARIIAALTDFLAADCPAKVANLAHPPVAKPVQLVMSVADALT